MSPKSVAIVCALLVLGVCQILGAAVTTVRPYKFGFTIDEQQHRAEQRDERGIVMGEFGFITADGIYHVTVYATDEEGRFRIISMKSYPYAGPVSTKSVPVATTTPKALPVAATPPKYNFNTEGCAGCFLKKTPSTGTGKTEIRTLSQPLGPAGTGKDRGVNVELPFRSSIAKAVLGLPQGTPLTVTHHSTYTNPNTNGASQKQIEYGLDVAMTTFTTAKQAVTGHVSTQTQSSHSPSASRKVDYNVGVTTKATTTYGPLNTQLNRADFPKPGVYSSGVGSSPLPSLSNLPLVAPATVPASDVKIFAVGSGSPVYPGVGFGHGSGGVKSAKRVSSSTKASHFGGAPNTQTYTPTRTLHTDQTPLSSSPTATGVFGVAAKSPTGSANPNKFGGSGAGGLGGSGAGGLGGSAGGVGKGVGGGVGGGVAGGFGGVGSSAGGKAGGVSGAGSFGGSRGSTLGSSGASGAGGFPQKGSTVSGTISRAGASGGSAASALGDLYKFKYVLDYNGHEETGGRNGDKQGSYFAIGDDAVERTVEYIANEFGFQPHISWRKLDAKAGALPQENSLKHYEFKWFNQPE